VADDSRAKFQVAIEVADRVTKPLRAIQAALMGTAKEAEHTKKALHGAAAGDDMKKFSSMWREMAKLAEPGSPIHAMGAEMEGLMKKVAASHKEAGAAAEHQGHIYSGLAGHVTLLRGHFFRLNENIGQTGRSLAELMPALAGLGIAASAGGLFELTNKTSEIASSLHATSLTLGTTVPQLQALNYAAKMTDVPVEAMQSGMSRLNRRLAEASSGKNKEAASIFHAIGLQLKDASGHTISAAQALPALAEALKRTHDPALRTAIAMQLMGRGGAAMLPMLLQGRAGLADLMQRYGKIGYGFSDEDQENLEAFHHSWIDLGTAVEGVGNSIGSVLAPVLTPVVAQFSEWVAANRAWIDLDTKKAVTELAGALSKVDWKGDAEKLRAMAGSVHGVVNEFGGMKTIAEGVGIVIALRFLAPVASAIRDLGLLVGAAGRAAFALDSTLAAAFASAGTAAGVFDKSFGRTLLGRTMTIGLMAYDAQQRGIDEKNLPPDSPLRSGPVTPAERARWERDNPTGLERVTGWWHGMFAAPDARPLLQDATPLPLAGRPGAAGTQSGQVNVHIKLSNAPPGTRVETQSSGIAAAPSVDVGMNYPMGVPLQ
jgi:hypothetical protein